MTEMAVSSSPELSPEEEKLTIRDISMGVEAQTKEGDTFYLITQRWWQDWLEYVNQNQATIANDGSSSERPDSVVLSNLKRPSAIDNSDLIYEAGSEDSTIGIELHDTLVEGTDYILLPQEVWNQLYAWYGGGPTLARKVINSGLSQTELAVEVYPLRLQLYLMPKGDKATIRISKKETIGELHRRACEIFDLNSEQVWIWDYYGRRKHALMNDLDKTLDDANIQMDQDILVEVVDNSHAALGGCMSSVQENGCADKETTLVLVEPSKSGFSIAGGLSASKGLSRNCNTESSQFQNVTSPGRESDNTHGIIGVTGVTTRGSSGGLTGLLNLGNTCFMNSAIQCLVHTPEFARYFREDYHKEINWHNPLGMVGELALAFGDLLRKLWAPGRTPVAPRPFKVKLARFAPQFSGYNQHDSQELLAFLLDGLHEDLNRVKHKPYIKSRDADGRPDEEVADEYWANHIARNDSIIVDVCQGQYKSTLVCPVCNKISVTFDPFMYLSLPLQSTTTRTMTVTVFTCDGSALPSACTVTVQKQGRCRDLIQAISNACSLKHNEKLLLAEIRGHLIHRFLEDPLISLSSIKDDDNLADNLFNQTIPLHLSQCSSLENLNLSNNLIWGPIPDQISQFGSLTVLDFSRNHVEGKIPESIGSLKNLQVLNLGSNLLSSSLPLVFGNFTELVALDLSQNPFLVSEIPTDIGKLGTLQHLLLQSSGFYGSIPESFVGLLGLTILDLSQNNLTGGLPQTLGSSVTNLVSFDVSQNKLSGLFPNGICNAKGLINLGLHTNLFNGSIPNNSISECLNLERFQVQNNVFSGDFPNGLWSLPKIKLIRAENNGFSGEIPDSISMAAQLEQVQIDNNSFSGMIPQGFGMVMSLYRFSASVNRFYGEIPPNFCDSPVMSIINLSHNSLSGRIPELRKCKKLVSLSLADNSLVGEIPSSLAELPVLTYLDFSDNNLTGPIPPELQNLKLALLNVSFNHLSGRVPSSLISGLPASFLQGNPDLCGLGLPNSCSDSKPDHKVAGLSKLACALISIALAVAILIVAVGFYLIRSSKRKSEMGIWRSVFFYPLRVTEHDLVMAMDDKSVAGSSGVFGRVHIVTLPSGELIAVKKILNFGSQSSKALKAEIKTLAKIRHKNINKILGFCHSDDSIFLIYEYLQKGSLGDMIRRLDFSLPWSGRLRIAIGVAQGLAYLHKDYVPRTLHRNVKSKNVLLDADFEPKLTDFALDRIVGEAAFQSSLASESADSCYMAPENGYSKKATEQMDTHSFGVVLLELVTGRPADQTESGDSLDVLKWVRRKINISNGALQVLDPKISNSSQQEMLGALEIALRCTSVMPEKRPSMPEVVRALQSLDSITHLPNADYFSTSDEHSIPV